MKAAFFHGLESNGVSQDKMTILNRYFSEVYAPTLDYRNPNTFRDCLKYAEMEFPDLLIGSSMGGWMTYCISTITGIPMLLFNPAFHSRAMEIPYKLGNKKAPCTIILGKNDITISPLKTIEWLKDNKIHADVRMVDMEHRIIANVFDASISYVVN